MAYPSEQVVGKLESGWSFDYSAGISILDRSSNQWIYGNITETSEWIITKYIINWNGSCIILKPGADALSDEFYEENQNEALARLEPLTFRTSFTPKYNVNIFSTKFPEVLYFLGITVKETRLERRFKI